MKILIPTDVDNPAPVSSLGGTNVVNNFAFKLRDAARVEVQFFTGNQGFGTAHQLAVNLELVLACKPSGQKKTDAVVLSNGFVWDAVNLLYVGQPSFKAGQLLGLFVGAAAVQSKSASYTLTAAEKSNLVIFSHASTAITITVPSLVGLAVNDYIDVLRGGLGDVSLVADSGVTLTVHPVLNVAPLLKTQILRITKTAAAVYSVALAPEEDSVALVGELTWRDLDGDLEDWSSTSDFNVTVSADVYRGFEGTPDNLDDASSYITIAAATAELALKANSADVYTKVASDAITAPFSAHLASTANPHSVTKAQVGLGSADNTSDLSKPISTLTQAALDLKSGILPDVIWAGNYVIPASVTVTHKGIVTAIVPARRSVLSSVVNVTASTANTLGPSLDLTGYTAAAGDIFDLIMFGTTTNGTTASNFVLSLQLGGSSIAGPSFAMGTTAATRHFQFRVLIQFMTNVHVRYSMLVSRGNTSTDSATQIVNGEVVASGTPSSLGLRCNVSVATGTSFQILAGSVLQR